MRERGQLTVPSFLLRFLWHHPPPLRAELPRPQNDRPPERLPRKEQSGYTYFERAQDRLQDLDQTVCQYGPNPVTPLVRPHLHSPVGLGLEQKEPVFHEAPRLFLAQALTGKLLVLKKIPHVPRTTQGVIELSLPTKLHLYYFFSFRPVRLPRVGCLRLRATTPTHWLCLVRWEPSGATAKRQAPRP